ncbi:5'/3'-nucleotidase SurE [Tepidibacter formicigenes]|jgi:5'-nucleotidase|uniref:5'-nucleotidase SurE n=1 Tax=Tepidibacter formicigenes DSM 15518 TaxID=1123349 RepID=A0A1M6M9G4_9FIRM|nr:5'/3'-nucleotidase SurE [Tepidibacter formicigenes]SHJ80095.1 5'-nucleotidase /3'-nucleotidase /exopolyphosphatase [Tepidibacter formicigenes DSM 15518]
MNILITNDDGIRARGIYELANAVKSIGNVYVVAPDSEKSAIGHAITMHSPLRVKEIDFCEGIKAYSVSGTPADCVKLGIEVILKDINIDFILSGINNGANLGTDVIYSGTVSGAIEGLIQNKPAMAISYVGKNITDEEYKKAGKYVLDIVNKYKNKLDILEDCVMNINIPKLKDKDSKGIKITKLGVRKYENAFEERIDPFGNKYYWMGGKIREFPQDEDSDIVAVEQGYISITPLYTDLTYYEKIKSLVI